MRKNEKNDSSTTVKKGFGRGHSIGRPVEKAKNFKGTLLRLMTYLKPRRIRLTVVVVLAILSTIFSIASPKILGKATTKIFEGLMMKYQGIVGASIDFEYVLNIVFILIGLYVISAIFNYTMQYLMASVAQLTVYEMREEVSEKLTKLPLKYYDSRPHGEILSRVTNDIDTISSTLQQSITQLITSVVTILGAIIMMLLISPTLTLIALVTLPLSVLFIRVIAKKSQVFFKAQQKTLGNLNGHIEEMYTGHKIIKAFGYEDKSIDKFNKINEELYEVGWKAQFISGLIMPLMNFINNIGYVFVSVIGAIFVTRGVVSIGDIQAFIQYTRQFGRPIVQTANITNIIQSTIASAERVFEVLDEEEEIPDVENLKIIENPNGNIRFDKIKFGYTKENILFKNIDIDVNAGQTVAIVGPTGAGKTTLVNLMMRFYELDGGKITVDGVDINDIKRGNLRNIFGMVLQDTWLFSGTIKENIAYGKDDATNDEIIKASLAAHADHFIRTLPGGYEFVINEEASNISQGQKQLLTIARAILANPSILILDEATSSVDTRTEVYVQKAMSALMKGRTNFVIAHRLSTIKGADVILVMNEGNIIEKGKHEELLEKDGFYAELYNSQFIGLDIKNKVS